MHGASAGNSLGNSGGLVGTEPPRAGILARVMTTWPIQDRSPL